MSFLLRAVGFGLERNRDWHFKHFPDNPHPYRLTILLIKYQGVVNQTSGIRGMVRVMGRLKLSIESWASEWA